MTLKEIQKKVAEFAHERAWDINMPSQRIAYLLRDVGRLAENTMFEEGMLINQPKTDMARNVGDCVFSLLCLANCLKIDAEKQLVLAIKEYASKYPAKETKEAQLDALVKKSKKYTVKSDSIENLR